MCWWSAGGDRRTVFTVQKVEKWRCWPMWRVWQSKPSPPLLSAHFPAGPLLAQETDGEKHSCLDQIEIGYQVKYFLHTDNGSEPKIHPGLCCYVYRVGKAKCDCSSTSELYFIFSEKQIHCRWYNFSHPIARGTYSFSWGTALPWLLLLSRLNPSQILQDASWADSCHQWAWFSCCCLPNDLFSNQEA